MKSLVSVALLLAGAQEPAGDGPRGSSQLAAGEVRYDRVGRAGHAGSDGAGATSADLPVGSYAEVTALDSGRTIVVAITGRADMAGRVIDLPAVAVSALGLGEAGAVRVRPVTPAPEDIAASASGRIAAGRPNAPEALVAALRRRLPAALPVADTKPAASTSRRQTPPAAPGGKSVRPTPTATGRHVVQVAALSNAARADAVARAIGGTVVAGPPLWRVRLGPFPDAAAAAAARDAAARRGYAGGQIIRLP